MVEYEQVVYEHYGDYQELFPIRATALEVKYDFTALFAPLKVNEERSE